MVRLLLLSWLGIAAGCSGFAQGSDGSTQPTLDIYPVRVNHKTGYVKLYNKPEGVVVHTVIPPRYDYIMDENLPYNRADPVKEIRSPYRLFEVDEKVGLLDASMQEILPPRYHRIRVITPTLFAVEEEEDALFALIDTSGHVFWDGERYEDVYLADSAGHASQQSYFLVKRNDFWGMRNLSGPLRIPHKFTDIRQTDTEGLFKVRIREAKGGWGVIDTAGNWFVKNIFEDIKVLSPHFMVALHEQNWKVLRKKREAEYELGGLNYQFVEKLNASLAILVTRNPVSDSLLLWSIGAEPKVLRSFAIPQNKSKSTARIIEELKNIKVFQSGNWIFPLDDRHVLHVNWNTVFSLLNNEGKSASREYEMIAPSGIPYVYKVLQRRRWGLLQPSREVALVLECGYDYLSDFQGRLAVCRQEGKFGVIAMADGEITRLPCIYESVTLHEGDRAQLQLNDLVVSIAYTQEQGFREEQISANALLISENTRFNFREAVPAPKIPLPSYSPTHLPAMSFLVRSDSVGIVTIKLPQREKDFSGSNPPDTLLWKERMPDNRRPYKVSEIVTDKVLAVFYQDTDYVSPFVPHKAGRNSAETRIYNRDQKAFAKDLPMLGFRLFDSIYTHTAFLDTAGQMGLMDRQGSQLVIDGKPVRYTYIGPFVAGRARVCIGGKLVVDERGLLEECPKFEISGYRRFLSEFQISPVKRDIPSMEKARIFAVGTPENLTRWGYIDTQGRLVIRTDADYVSDYHWKDSTAFFLQKNKRTIFEKPDADYGIINYNGDIIAPAIYTTVSNLPDFFLVTADSTPTFFFTKKGIELFVNPTRLRAFSDGLAHFFDPRTNLWGYIDTLGNIAVSPRFTQARPFSEGRALVADTLGMSMFINTAGQTVFFTDMPAKAHQFIGDFKNGRCWFKGKGWAWGCYDLYGETAIPPEFFYRPQGAALQSPPPDTANPLPLDFSMGVAVAATLVQGKIIYHFIDTLGKILSSHENLQRIAPPDEWGLAVCINHSNKKGIINIQGEMVLQPEYDEIASFINGYVKVKSPAGKWGLVNRKGREVLPCAYAAIDTVSEGLVAVRNSEQGPWYVFDTLNRQHIKDPFERIAPFKKGATLVSVHSGRKGINKLGEEIYQLIGTKLLFYNEGFFGVEDQGPAKAGQYYADASGNNVFGRYFQEINPFQFGVAKVKHKVMGSRSELYGAINKRGVLIVPPKFNNLHVQANGNIITNPQRFLGLLDKKGNVLIPPYYDRIEQYADKTIFRVERGEAVGYVWIKEGIAEWIWDLQR